MAHPRRREADPVNLASLLDELEQGIEDLRLAYEKYFLGVDKKSPVKRHEDLLRLMRLCSKQHPRGVVQRFRMQGLRARLVTYQHYWTRILGEMERGVFRRQSHRPLRPEPQGAPTALPSNDPTPLPELEIQHSQSIVLAGRSEASIMERLRSLSPQAKPKPVLPPGMSPEQLDSLHRELIAAKQAAGERVEGLTVDALGRKLASEAARLAERHQGVQVRFELAKEGGKVRLRAKQG